MADNLVVLLHHIVQLRDEVGIAPVLVEHIVFGASWTVDIPERLACEVLYLAIVLRLFESDVHSAIITICKTSSQCFFETLLRLGIVQILGFALFACFSQCFFETLLRLGIVQILGFALFAHFSQCLKQAAKIHTFPD